MSLKESLLAELEQEASTTKKILEKIPTEKLTWKPHQKSYAIGALGAHIAEIPSWLGLMLNADELDFGTMDYKPPVINENADIMKVFEENLSKGKAILEQATDEQFEGNWRMRQGDQIFFELPRTVVIRTWIFSHIVHHRAQLGVYLRLLDIPVPVTYGTSADSQGM